MTQNGWFPRWSADAAHILSGFGEVWLDGAYLMPGFSGGWLDDTSYICLDARGFVCRGTVGQGVPAAQFRGPFNSIAVGGGKWVGWRAPDFVETSDNTVPLRNAFSPAVSPLGRFGYLENPSANTQRLVVEGWNLDVTGALADLHFSRFAATWIAFSSPTARSPWVSVNGGTPQNVHASWQPFELEPKIVETPDGFWVMSYDNDRLMLRPIGATLGIVVHQGTTDHPDIVWAGGVFHVAWSDRGVLKPVVVDPASERVDLSVEPHPVPMPGPKPPPAPGPPPPAPPPRPITPRPPVDPVPPERTPVVPPISSIVTFKSAHGRYLCAEEGGGAIITGDREQADVWERFTLTPIGETYVTLQSADGHYVCAEEGGGQELTATRDAYGAWEAFRLIPVDGGHAIQVSDGRYVCAEPDGSVVADRTEIGSYETWTVDGLPVPEPPAPPEPGPGPTPVPPPSSGRVRLQGRVLHDDDGPFFGIGATLMAAPWFERNDTTTLDQEIAVLEQGGVRFGRMLGCVGVQPYWSGREIDPRWSDYRDVMIATLGRFVAHGMRAEVTLIGDGQVMVPSSQDKRDLVDTWISIIAARPESVVLAEIGNEAWQNGFPGSGGEQELRNLGRRLRDGLRARNIFVPVALSSPETPDAASLQSLYGGGNADVVTAHYDRDCNKVDGAWRPVRQPWDTQFVSGIPEGRSNNEPIGYESSVAADDDPTRLVAAMVVSFIAGHAYHVLHADTGVRMRQSWSTNPGIAQVWQGIHTIRRLLPPDLAGWTPQNDHWSEHPYQTVEKWVDGASEGVVRAYAATSGARFVCLPMGIRNGVTLAARHAHTVNIHDLLTGELLNTKTLNTGESYRLDDSHSAYLLLGRFA